MSYRLRTGQTIAGLDPDEVRAAAVALRYYGGMLGPLDSLREPDAMAHALAAYLGAVSRREADERAHARRRDDPLRLANLAFTLERARNIRDAVSEWRKRRTAEDDVL